MLNWQNVIDGHGVGIAITGMLIVFFGLLMISLFIIALPKMLTLGDSKVKAEKTAAAKSNEAKTLLEPTEEDIIAVLTLVLHAEMDRDLGDLASLTISRQQKTGSVWASAGKMRSLSRGGL